MHFEMEELIPIVARLAEEYTAFESTSIPYEKAEQLMEAVLYCIHELELSETEENAAPAENSADAHSQLLVQEKKLSAKQAYRYGRDCVEQKTRRALQLYHEILPEFCSFGNRCLNENFIKRLPEFFKWYDIKFDPQKTILTIDYPVLKDISGFTGIDKIYEFIQCISLEQNFLQMFPEEYVTETLEKYVQRINNDLDAGRDLVENICEMVLAAVIPHFLVNKPLEEQSFQESEYAELQEIFSQTELPELRKQMEDAVRRFVQKYTQGALLHADPFGMGGLRPIRNTWDKQDKMEKELSEYLSGAVNGLAVRLKNAAMSGTLCRMIMI